MDKKLSKKFDSFEAEEKWLMELAQEGWRLISYDSADVDACTYKFVKDPAASQYRYQIDYRDFNKKLDYEEYKNLFEETGWTILSKNFFYSKHIFVSSSKNEIFSDPKSRLERDVNRYRSAKLYVAMFMLLAIVTGGLYYYFDFEISVLGFLTIVGLGGAVYHTIDARKRIKKIRHVNMG